MKRRTLLAIFLAAALATGGAVSYWACRSPDGLEKTAGDQKLISAAQAPAVAPLAEYKIPGLANEFLSNGLAGILGALLVLAVVLILGRFLKKKAPPPRPTPAID